MLRNTFCHIPGIGEKTERRLWAAGFTSWTAPFERTDGGFRPAWTEHVQESQRRYAEADLDYFSERLPGGCQWRLFHDFRDACAYVDIETTGLGPSAEITTAALFDGREVRWYVSGQNLDQLARDIARYRLLVSYNGKCFDVPVIEGQFGIRLPRAHVDLRYVLRSLGHKGGLKACERSVGLARPGLEDVDGFAAVLLWDEYRRTGSPKALETLLAYNIQDVVSLPALAIYAHNEKVQKTPFALTHTLPASPAPGVPFRADPATVDRVLRRRAHLYASWGQEVLR